VSYPHRSATAAATTGYSCPRSAVDTALEIYLSSRVSIGKVKRVFVSQPYATIKPRAYRRLARYTAKCGGIRPEKGPLWNSL